MKASRARVPNSLAKGVRPARMPYRRRHASGNTPQSAPVSVAGTEIVRSVGTRRTASRKGAGVPKGSTSMWVKSPGGTPARRSARTLLPPPLAWRFFAAGAPLEARGRQRPAPGEAVEQMPLPQAPKREHGEVSVHRHRGVVEREGGPLSRAPPPQYGWGLQGGGGPPAPPPPGPPPPPPPGGGRKHPPQRD